MVYDLALSGKADSVAHLKIFYCATRDILLTYRQNRRFHGQLFSEENILSILEMLGALN